MCASDTIVFTFALACAVAFTYHHHNIPRAIVDFVVAVTPRVVRAAAQTLIALTIFICVLGFAQGFISALAHDVAGGPARRWGLS